MAGLINLRSISLCTLKTLAVVVENTTTASIFPRDSYVE
jgi:hypothetical protein